MNGTVGQFVLVADDGCNLRQGDVVELATIPVHQEQAQPAAELPTPRGVAVLSQTCDLVHPSKPRCLIAPLLGDPTSEDVSDARKGRRPLLLHLGEQSIADMSLATSVPKSWLSGRAIVSRFAENPSGPDAGSLAKLIARAFGRFAFPDEVHSILAVLQTRARSASPNGPLGQVLDRVTGIRVSADDWTDVGVLRVWLLIDARHIGSVDDLDPAWVFSPARVLCARPTEVLGDADRNRICELILANLAGDLTTLSALWGELASRLETDMAKAGACSNVAVTVEALSLENLSAADYICSESLDLEALSMPHHG